MATKPEEEALNAFETAILEALAHELPSLTLDVRTLQVTGRKYTGVGSYTDFVCEASGEREYFSLKAHITMPGVPGGMGAVLYCHDQKPACLETFTFGNDAWTGTSDGFAVG